MELPEGFEWLATEPTTRMIEEALRYYGTTEDLSSNNNATILQWANTIGGNVADVYKADSVPWCGLYMAIVAKNAGKHVVDEPLWALNWGNFGTLATTPMLGDVLVFTRLTPEGNHAGHVGIYVGENENNYFVLGGNQSDKVCITSMPKSRLYVCRRPNYHIQPNSVSIRMINNSDVRLDSLA